eukprot:2963995-Pleurochrysis_carterae.AAC.4
MKTATSSVSHWQNLRRKRRNPTTRGQVQAPRRRMSATSPVCEQSVRVTEACCAGVEGIWAGSSGETRAP